MGNMETWECGNAGIRKTLGFPDSKKLRHPCFDKVSAARLKPGISQIFFPTMCFLEGCGIPQGKHSPLGTSKDLGGKEPGVS